jgi:hypothetical protein
MSERSNRERRRLVSRLALALTAAHLGPMGTAMEQRACAAIRSHAVGLSSAKSVGMPSIGEPMLKIEP